MVLEDSEGQKDVTLARDIHIANYYEQIQPFGDVWSVLESGSESYGYVDMGRLEVDQVNSMFQELWDTDGIIFDIRSYPRSTMNYMIRYLFDAPIPIARFTVPDIEYPGTLWWSLQTVGFGNFSLTYEKPIVILLDERTQSQAEYTVMALEQHPHALKIGSQTAGADGNVSKIYLPGGIRTFFTGLGVFYPDYTETQRIGIVPDYEVHPTIAGIREGRDELLEAALQYLDGAFDLYQLPHAYLLQSYPNPFNGQATLQFVLPVPSNVKLEIHNILGQLVEILVDGQLPAGTHLVRWDASRYSSGVYFYRLKAGDFTATRKMVLLK
jgi:hypothetical protein